MEKRFWAKVDKSGECWLWTGGFFNVGYGAISGPDRRPRKAHRYSYELAHGPIPDGLWVLHRCNVRACVRPDHLYLGTHTDNMADRKRAQRQARGNDLPFAKLTPEIVHEVRRLHDLGLGSSAIGRRLHIPQTTASDVSLRKTWRHII